jgi:hypothetical protein
MKIKYKLLKRSFLVLLVFSLFFSVCDRSQAADADDFYWHGLADWNLDTQRPSFGLIYGYYPWDEFGLGLNYEQEKYYSAVGLDMRWSFEPFEIFMAHNATYWSQKGGSWHYLFQLGTNYLIALSASSAIYLQVKGNFPQQKGRSLLLGGGLRLLF